MLVFMLAAALLQTTRPSGMPAYSVPKALLISLGDFIANIPAAHRAGDGCQRLAIASAYLVAQQSADDCADTDTDGTIVGNSRGRLLVGWCGLLLVRRRLGIRLAGLRLGVLDGMVVYDSFVLDAFVSDCRSNRELLHGWLRGGRYRCRRRCGGEGLYSHRRSLYSDRRSSRGVRSRQDARYRCNSHQAHENDGNGSAGHQRVDAV
jgi:hypothetical protein